MSPGTIAVAPGTRRSSMPLRRRCTPDWLAAGEATIANESHPAFPAASTVGQSLPRPNARYLVAGRGCYTDDITLPRMAHVAFLRSPVPHGRIRSLNAARACAMPGVIRAV